MPDSKKGLASGTESGRRRLSRDGMSAAPSKHFDLMKAKLVFLAIVLACLCGASMAQQSSGRYIRVGELQIDPAQVEAFGVAIREIGEAAVRLEEGCIGLYAVADADNPS